MFQLFIKILCLFLVDGTERTVSMTSMNTLLNLIFGMISRKLQDRGPHPDIGMTCAYTIIFCVLLVVLMSLRIDSTMFTNIILKRESG